MLQKYQKYLAENNYKVFLKYDGIRQKNKYTVRLFEKNKDGQVTSYGRDTNNPRDMLISVLKDLYCPCILDIEQHLYTMFITISEFVMKDCGTETIVVLSAEFIDDNIKYFSYISGNKNELIYQNDNLENLWAEIKDIN